MSATPDTNTPAQAVTRAELEAREQTLLASYAMRCELSQGRQHDEPEHAYRTTYMRDRDRIIHASAFRRLEYKTQVFVNHEGDYYRTRLTHTMEVAQVARTAARALRLNEDLTESIALSHDLGHGPFGHKGEYVLHDLMEEHGGFEHNAHGLRVVDRLERRYPRWRGLNLSYEVREAFALHSPKDTESLGFRAGLQPLLEAQLVDVCDSLTYVAHDIDDGVASGLLAIDELHSDDLWSEHWTRTLAAEPDLPRDLQVLTTVKHLIDAGVTDLVDSTRARIQAAGVDSPEAVQAHGRRLVGFSDGMHRRQRALSRYLYEHFYCHPRLMRMGARARRILTALFRAYREEPRMLTVRDRAWAEEVGLERAICDHLASMTDRQALDEYASS
ncbi:MAG: deoxyguanosinetriphosphate triphosphohydrolase [Planctomycetota bacterium]|nr:deoxyguanosinetriphosphate triphosphohydrolase [Planctomycetota bacterium]